MGKNLIFTTYSLLILILSSFDAPAQSTDVIRLEYLNIPENDSGISTERYKFLVNVPIKLNEDDYVVLGSEYNSFKIGFPKEFAIENEALRSLHIIDLNLGYITRWNEDWRLVSILTPRLASNFTESVLKDDFFFNATVTLWKQGKKNDRPFRLVLGLTFNSTTGLPFPLPLVSYYNQFHPKWSYTLGIPRMNFKYHPFEKHTLQVALLFDGYFVNIQDDILLPDDSFGTRISLSAMVGALGYQYNVTQRTSFFVLAGRSIIQEGILRNDKRENVFLLNDKTNFYLRGGFKISIF
jgi:hypothetical protein